MPDHGFYGVVKFIKCRKTVIYNVTPCIQTRIREMNINVKMAKIEFKKVNMTGWSDRPCQQERLPLERLVAQPGIPKQVPPA